MYMKLQNRIINALNRFFRINIIAPLFAFVSVLKGSVAIAAYTPLIVSTDFDGIRADVLTVAGGVISILLVIVGLALLMKTLSR